ncbi:hypothetical protein BASA81_004867 [Batrachochytrium salamandrivorans]|nr:hypothetical protein BASA81_004867 [Batrachochytrium salamandrivorans]
MDLTSLKVFRMYFVVREDGSLDASRLLSRECYSAWVDSRRKEIPSPETRFQRSLSSHITSLDGRVPFTEAEEVAVLKEVRKRRVWACFENSEKKVGVRGFCSMGFHEKRRLGGINPAKPITTVMGESQQSVSQQKRIKVMQEDGEEAIPRFHLPSPPSSSFLHIKAESTPLYAYSPFNTTVATSTSPFCLEQFSPNLVQSVAIDVSPFQGEKAIKLDHNVEGEKVQNMTYTEIAAYANPEYLVQLLEHMTNMVAASPVDRWKALFMFSMEWTRGVIANADRTRIPEVVQWIETQTPQVTDWVILVIDSMTKTYNDRYMAQNENAKNILGNLVGKPDALFRKDDLIMLVILTGASYNNPGREFPVQFYLKCKDGVERQFDMRFYVDPITALGIVKAKLIE